VEAPFGPDGAGSDPGSDPVEKGALTRTEELRHTRYHLNMNLILMRTPESLPSVFPPG
jgi:hypothetical protein